VKKESVHDVLTRFLNVVYAPTILSCWVGKVKIEFHDYEGCMNTKLGDM
jgi:hypothetical protein